MTGGRLRRGDDFYRHVAAFVRQYEGRDFGRALAAASDVPLTTAHCWIRIARERGFLPPATSKRAAQFVCPRCGFTRAAHWRVPDTITDVRERCIYLLRQRIQELESHQHE